MPLIEHSSYRPPFGWRNAHLQTSFPALFRKVPGVHYSRERIETPDEDFLDLDWSKAGARRAAVVSHGLGGNTRRGYVLGMVRALNRRGWDVLAWNFRGCSGVPNRKLRSYHSGATEDLDVVVQHVLRQGYDEVALVGFSLGGNLVVKYLGEQETNADERIRRAVAFSVPCELAAGAAHMTRRASWLYMQNFLQVMRAQLEAKRALFPDEVAALNIAQFRSFHDIDGHYTAPVHGFESAEAYWRQSSCKRFIAGVRVPTLIVNAADDPLLPPPCHPVAEARASRYVSLEMPAHGGHLGFVAFNEAREYWSETRAAAFLCADAGDESVSIRA